MAEDYCSGCEKRNKRRDKFKNKKKFPYKRGGKWRITGERALK